MKNAQEHNEYTEKENDQLRTDALMMINALRAQHGDAVTRVISHLAASDPVSYTHLLQRPNSAFSCRQRELLSKAPAPKRGAP